MTDRTTESEHPISTQRRAFELAQRAARRAVQRRLRVVRLTKQAYVKSGRERGALKHVAADLHTMIRMARAWATRSYAGIPWRSVIYVVAAIIYFVNPADLIPDVLAGIGFVDDAAVIGSVVHSVTDDLSAFRDWERRRRIVEESDTPRINELSPASSVAA